jgi:hypothetical protein
MVMAGSTNPHPNRDKTGWEMKISCLFARLAEPGDGKMICHLIWGMKKARIPRILFKRQKKRLMKTA